MDPFTQRILEKAEQRSKALGISKTVKYPLGEIQETVSKSIEPPASVTNKKGKESTSKIRHRCPSNEDNVDVGIQINITTGPNVEVEIEVQDDNKEEASTCPSESDSKGECASKIRECSRNRLQRLGALYSNNDLSSPIHRTEGKFHEEEQDSSEASARRPKQKLGKLVALADAINNWEDDTSHPDYKQSKRDNKLEETCSTTDTNSRSTEPSCSNSEKNNTKHLKWDKNVMDSLEAQGFQRRESTGVKMSYQYENRKGEDKENDKGAKLKSDNTASIVGTKLKHTPSPKSKQQARFSSIKTGAVSGRIAEFDNKLSSPNKQQKDPAEMSLKERMMVFEKNKGKALLPKAAFGMPAPVAKFTQKNTKTDDSSRKCGSAPPRDFPVDVKVKEKVAALASGSSTISECKIKEDIIKQKQRDMEILAKRFDKQRDVHTSESEPIPPPPPPPMPAQKSSSVNIEAKNISCNKRRSPGSIDESKRLKADTTPPRLYPVLPELESDDNCTTATVSTSSPSDRHRNICDPYDSEMDSENDEDSNESLGEKVLQNVRKNASLERKKYKEVRYADTNTQIHYDESSENTSASSECFGEVDDYLDEALCQDESSNSAQRRHSHRRSSRGVTSSDSFYYEKQPKRYQNYNDNSTEEDEKDENPVRSVLTVNPSGNDDTVRLVHTVSFYRQQQSNNSNNSTPARTNQVKQQYEHHDENDEKSESSESSDAEMSDPEDPNAVQEKIKYLLDEVCKQQQIIAQTSHALNLCASTIEFSGSTEAVEGERHLLVASHRRRAALDEVQRLKIEGTLRPRRSREDKGRLTVNEITVPLRRDYVRRLSTETIAGHHLVCLLKYGEHVLATKTVSTLPGLLAVKFPDVLQINNVYADFRAVLEIYGIGAQREVLPHEIKYHINLNKKSGSKTPNKKKAGDSRLFMMPSLGDPNALRIPALTKYGFVVLSLRDIRRTNWSLIQFCNISPLEGCVHLKTSYELQASIKHRGFLTMFQDISGFGAWHRRWCLLDRYVLNYWKYPDDEKKKAPMGSIDLNNCISRSANLAPRDVCSRLNTILLECQRPAEETDIESLIIIPKGRVTIVRHLLSADTKDERDGWCAIFNRILSLLREMHGRK